MTALTIRDVFDLPPSIPRCIVKIQDFDDLKAGVSRIRNRVIVRVLRELSLVKEWGTGYRRVTQACEAGGYPPPTWQELGAALRVIFEPHPEATDEVGEPSDVPASVPDVP